ncbi:GH-E family nuclease [Thiosocius teredinicola]
MPERRELHRRYMDGEITKRQFLEEIRNPGNYHPEDPPANRSHEFMEDW